MMRLRRLLVYTTMILLSGGLLTGCFKPQGRGSDSTSWGAQEASPASFYIEGEVTGTSSVASNVEGFSIPDSQLFNFAVCLKNKKTKELVIGHKFLISGTNIEKEETSDGKGCVRWHETIQFNYLGTEAYLPLQRKLIAKGMETGALNLVIGVNPWLLTEKALPVVDLIRSSVPNTMTVEPARFESALRGMGKDGSEPTRALWFKNVLVNNTTPEKSNGSDQVVRHFQLRLAPHLMHETALKLRKEVPLTDARFEVTAALLETSSEAGRERATLIWQSSEPVQARRVDTLFAADFDVVIPSGNASTGLQLLLRAKPIGAPKGLQAFEGLFELGEFNQVMGARVVEGKLRSSSSEGGNFSFESKIKQLSESSAASGPGTSRSRSKPAKIFLLSRPDADLLRTNDETSVVRERIFMVKACLKDVANGNRPAVGVTFQVEKPDGSVESITTSQEETEAGCLKWEDKMTHHYYAFEKYYLYSFTIRHQSGYEEKRTIAMNPWTHMKWYFSRDLADSNDTERNHVERANGRPVVKARILVDRMNFDTIETRKHDVDPYLNVVLLKRIQMKFPVRVKRNTILEGNHERPEPLRDGVYLFKSAIYVNGQDPTGKDLETIVQPAYGAQRLVRVKNGELTVAVDYPISSPLLVFARGSVVFKIQPVDESKLTEEEIHDLRVTRVDVDSIIDRRAEMTTPTFVTPILLRHEGGGSNVDTTDEIAASVQGSGLETEPLEKKIVRPLANADLDQLLEKAKEQTQLYKKQMAEYSQLAEFSKRANTDYVPLYHESHLLTQQPSIATINRALPKTGSAAYLVNYLNTARPELVANSALNFPAMRHRVTNDFLAKMVEGDFRMDDAMAARFCMLLLKDMPNNQAPEGSFFKPDVIPHFVWVNDCIRTAQTKGVDSALVVDRKARVFKRGEASRVSSNQLQFQVGADVSFGRNDSAGWTGGYSPGKMLEELMKIGGKADILRIPLELISPTTAIKTGFTAGANFLASAIAASGISFTMSRGFTASISEGSKLNANKNLNMSYVEMRLPLKEYEKCSIVRVNPSFIEKRMSRMAFVNPKINPVKALEMLSRGVMICTGYVSLRPVDVLERYYTISHGGEDDALLDHGDPFNHPFLVRLRGRQDYGTFLQVVAAKPKYTVEKVKEVKMDIGEFPLDRLDEAYEHYRGLTTTTPGIYTFNVKASAAP